MPLSTSPQTCAEVMRRRITVLDSQQAAVLQIKAEPALTVSVKKHCFPPSDFAVTLWANCAMRTLRKVSDRMPGH
jgi:hypothetical protein